MHSFTEDQPEHEGKCKNLKTGNPSICDQPVQVTSEAKDHDLFLKKSPEMRSGQISLERLRRDELDLTKNLSGMHVGDRF
jgi:hypothetical protein